ncbi:MAG TPA: cation:proton antiporter, partial [Bdellovibrionota bacterium]|nr:cation:proton antiporter [Bdellovibrionota bacterium]
GKLNLPESKVILGAAVIDDVLGLIVLAVVTGIVGGGSLGFGSILQTSFMAILFLGGSILIGLWVAPRLINIFQRFEVRGNKLAISLGICFSMALLAKKAGLAPIVGAFAGGLILDNVYFVKYKEQRPLEEILSPIGDLFVPVFFVVIGMGVHLELIFQSQIILIGTLLLAVAIVGKFVAGWAVLPQKMNFAAIGFGMIPRGEVGFIFASEGLRLGVLSNQLYAVIIFLVMATTLISPPLLNLSLKRTFVTPKS